MLPRTSLITIYKAFIRQHLDYGDVIFDKAFNNSFHQRLEPIQRNIALAITGVIRGTSKEKLYQELGFESLQSRRWFRKLIPFYKIIKNKPPSYLYHLMPKPLTSYTTRNSEDLPPIKANHSFFKNTFFLSTIIESNKLDSNICCSPSYKLSRKRILEFTSLQPKHYLLHFSNFMHETHSLLQNVRIVNSNLLSMKKIALTHLLLYGDNTLTDKTNTLLLNSVIE